MTQYQPTQQELHACARTARTIAHKWPGVDQEEIQATLHLWLVENQHHVERYRTDPNGAAKLTIALTRHAHQTAAHEHRAAHHYPDTQWYTRDQLTRILPHIWDTDTWPQTTSLDHTPHTPNHEHGDAITILTDTRTAYQNLTDTDRHLLAWRYHDENTYAEIGARLGITDEAARKRTTRALTRLHHALGGDQHQ